MRTSFSLVLGLHLFCLSFPFLILFFFFFFLFLSCVKRLLDKLEQTAAPRQPEDAAGYDAGAADVPLTSKELGLGVSRHRSDRYT